MQNENSQDKPLKAIAGSPDRPVKIANLALEAYVLADGTRVLSERGVLKALGMAPGARDTEEKLPRYLRGKNLAELVDIDLKNKLTDPIWFVPQSGGAARKGVPATVLPDILDVWLKARDAGVLAKTQLETAKQADILMRGLAHVGIIALVDEATGYQKQKDEYQKILEQWIATELRPWVHTFDDNFYRQIYRLNGWTWDAFKSKKKQHPQIVGQFTNRIVYEKLAPGLIEILQKLNPKNEKGNRARKHHQHLSENQGYIGLIKHIASVTTIMEQFPDGAWVDAVHKIDTRYPSQKIGAQLVMDFSIGDSSRMNKAIDVAARPGQEGKKKSA